MKKENFCKVFIFSILNLIVFLLSIIFLTSVINIKDQNHYINSELDCGNKKEFDNHYSAIAALVSFVFIGVIAYIIFLILLIKKDKFDNGDSYNNEYNRKNVIIQNNFENNNIIYDINSDLYRMEKPQKNIEQKDDDESDIFETDKYLKNLLFWTFFAIQVLYFIEVIVLSAFLGGANNYQKKVGFHCEDEIKELKNVYIVLIIVGYIFLAIFIFFYLFLLVLYKKLGSGVQKKVDNLIESTYCECSNSCLKSLCTSCSNYFKTMTDDEIQQQNLNEVENIEEENERKRKNIEELKKYKEKLNSKVCYELSSKNAKEQEKIIRDMFSNDQDIVNKYMKKNEKMNIITFRPYLDKIISEEDPFVYVYVSDKNKDYNYLSDIIHTIYDNRIYRGIMIKHKNKMYDFCIK